MSAARALVVGYGSIGRRHAQLLAELGAEVAVVSRRGEGAFRTVTEGVAAHRPGYVVVATETSDHARVVAELAACGYAGRLAVEKPLFDAPGPFPWAGFAKVAVAYPLRCHPALMALKAELGEQRVLAAQFYVGQYLPDWRPGRDYRDTYSAHADQGGGVLRDLSHELDLANWLLGPWQRLAASGGHFSALEIDSDDVFAILSRHERCPAATIQLNYLDRRLRRSILLHTDRHSYAVDLVAHTLQRDGGEAQIFAPDRDTYFRGLHHAMLSGDDAHLCTLAEGLDALEMVAAAERAAAGGDWQSSSQQGES
jgi:predicted dehydrogenase